MIHSITPEDPLFPGSLKTIHDAPKKLWFEGEGSCLTQGPHLALVGTRECSSQGKEIAYNLARQLVDYGWVVVSGFAYGIDTAAHEGALDAGGKTIGVMGCGLGVPYLKQNDVLRERIKKQGVLVSEFSPETEPAVWTFPRRNRIISGLSLGIVVIEAPEKSGALLTAKYALEQGREVFAVPGAPHHSQSMGSNRLIQKGAKLVLTIHDILEEFPYLQHQEKNKKENLDSEKKEVQRVLHFLSEGPRSMDQLIDGLGTSVQEMSALLLEMEMAGRVRSLSSGVYRVV